MKTKNLKERDQNSNVFLLNKRKSPVQCVCPRCGITHLLNFFWSGKGTPKKFCHRCREAVSGIDDQCIYEAAPNVFRVHRGVTTAQQSED